jgi:hypothetical protein
MSKPSFLRSFGFATQQIYDLAQETGCWSSAVLD